MCGEKKKNSWRCRPSPSFGFDTRCQSTPPRMRGHCGGPDPHFPPCVLNRQCAVKLTSSPRFVETNYEPEPSRNRTASLWPEGASGHDLRKGPYRPSIQFCHWESVPAGK